jgi:N-acetylglucosaminyldiphosphoundecaprenol N-acetyl-beta-D-mannosaminyltransferase
MAPMPPNQTSKSSTSEAAPAAVVPCAVPAMVRLLGLDFADVDVKTAAAWIAARSAEVPFRYVVNPNADHLTHISRDPALAEVYRGASLRLMDSRVVVGMARLLGLPHPPVVHGTDLTPELLRQHLRPGEKVTIIGLRPEHLPALRDRCGPMEIAHHYPPMGFDHDPAAFRVAVDFVLANPARFIFLAVGMPRQERLAAAIQATGRACGTALCIGSALEFVAGAQRRAPLWMQHMGLEWLHRLSREPRRLARRYLVQCPPVLAFLLNERLHRRGQA